MTVVVKFFLRVDKLKHLCSLPPLWVSLNHDSVWINFLNKLLSSLCKHSGLIKRAYQEYFLAIEALRQVHKCCVKAVHPVTLSIELITVGISSSHEDVPRSDGGIVGSGELPVHRIV